MTPGGAGGSSSPAPRPIAIPFPLPGKATRHPSGDPTPSEADLAMTKEVQKGCRFLGLTLHDHIIVGAGHEVSLRGLGKI